MTFLLGRQAMLGQEPPRYLRSIVATGCPCCANVHARNFDPVPLPSITRSYSSASVILALVLDEEVSTLLISVSFPLRERCKGKGAPVSCTLVFDGDSNEILFE